MISFHIRASHHTHTTYRCPRSTRCRLLRCPCRTNQSPFAPDCTLQPSPCWHMLSRRTFVILTKMWIQLSDLWVVRRELAEGTLATSSSCWSYLAAGSDIPCCSGKCILVRAVPQRSSPHVTRIESLSSRLTLLWGCHLCNVLCI